MFAFWKSCFRVFMFLLVAACVAGAAFAQKSTGTLQGQVTDETGALIPGAKITISGPAGFTKTIVAGADGSYTLASLSPGSYTVTASAPGLANYTGNVQIVAGKSAQLVIAMKVAAEKQEVTVQGEAGPEVSTQPENNAGSLTLRGADLDALPDDPDDLAADLQALAGPSAGPSGGQMYIDGFSGGELPPKDSIREIRINQNPFSAEYDKLGYGRIEIFTKPGTDKFHGQGYFNFGDAFLNSRNPYAPNKPSFQSRMFGGVFSGPLSKHASFTFDVRRRDIDDNSVINGTILDSNLNPEPFSQAILTPNHNTSISPRIDYQLTTNNTLTARYRYSSVAQDNAGIGQFSLLSRAYNTSSDYHTLQLTETAMLGPRVINEARFEYERSNMNQLGDNSLPAINVLEAFNGGGAQVGNTYNNQNYFEFQNYTSLALKKHTVRMGVRVRTTNFDEVSPQNFGGTFTFGGGFAPELNADNQTVLDPVTGQPVLTQITSIERYRRTLLFQQQGYTPQQILALGGGATQFSIAAGNPAAAISQTDVGAFVQDDWRMRSNFTLSLGLRYETQTNISDYRDFAPRIGFAWAPGGRRGRQGKTVIRGGLGIFYDRFGESLSLQALRFNGVNQQQYIVPDPSFYPQVPSVSSLGVQAQPQAMWRVDSNLRAPEIIQTAIGVERQLTRTTTLASTFTNSRGIHMLRADNINAPIGYIPNVSSGVRPYGDIGDIFLYESSGIFNQRQWITNVNSRLRSNVAIFAFYVLNYAKSNTDGASSFPENPYNFSLDYGRSSMDIRHRFVLGGSLAGPFHFQLSPFIIVHSGAPYNITIGRDSNGDTVFTDRPAFATDPNKPTVVMTPYGALDTSPTPGETIIPRNYGQGPGYFTINLRLAKTFGFGPSREGNSGGPDRGGHYHGGGHGAMRMGGGGFHSIFAGSNTGKRYNLTLGIMARNLLNTVNPASPIGNLTSPLFGQSNALASSFGPAANAANRHVEFQLRFSF